MITIAGIIMTMISSNGVENDDNKMRVITIAVIMMAMISDDGVENDDNSNNYDKL